MRLVTLYLIKHYLKNFFILLMGMSFAVVLIDLMQHITSLSGGMNIKILYLFYRWESVLTLIYPVAIVLALVMTKMSFVKENRWVALYSFGYSPKSLLKPMFLTASFIYIIFISLQFTEFSYSKESADAILHQNQANIEINELFFKYDNDFVYVKELDPVKKIIYNVTVFVIDKGLVSTIITFPKANYKDGRWIAHNVTIKSKKYQNGKLSGYFTRETKTLHILEGYKPKVVKLIYEGHSLTLIDGWNAYTLLKKQNLDTTKIKALLYNKIIMPLFALSMIIIFFFKIPSYQRFMKRELVWAQSIGITLIVWGVLHALFWLAGSGVIRPDFAQPPVIILLTIYAIYLYTKERS